MSKPAADPRPPGKVPRPLAFGASAAAAEELSAQAVELQSIATRLFVLVEGAAAKPAAGSTSGTPAYPPAPGSNAELRQPELVRA